MTEMPTAKGAIKDSWDNKGFDENIAHRKMRFLPSFVIINRRSSLIKLFNHRQHALSFIETFYCLPAVFINEQNMHHCVLSVFFSSRGVSQLIVEDMNEDDSVTRI